MFNRLTDFIYHQATHYPTDRAFARRGADDQWLWWSTQDLIDQSKRLAAGMLAQGIRPGDKVAIVAYQNRPEWVVVDLACLHTGIITVPMYPTISAREYSYIMSEAEVKMAFVGKDDLYDKVSEAAKTATELKQIYTFDQQAGRDHWESIMTDDGIDEVDSLHNNIGTDDLATIIYTSGTTGEPKGVMLNHKALITVVLETADTMPFDQTSDALSFLPFCHVFERAVLYAYTWRGSHVHCTGTDNLGGDHGDLRSVRPHFFTTVPRLLEKVYEKIYNKGQDLTGIKKKLFFWALGMVDDFEYNQPKKGLAGLKMAIADKLIFSKWREALGGRLVAIITGAAPCPAKIAKVFSAAGIPILEGYGLTETAPTISINTYGGKGAKIGTVGVPIPSVTVHIDTTDAAYGPGEGEILVYGPNVMMGYYKKPEATEAVFRVIDGQRYFCTGDIGKFVQGHDRLQYLKITDRKKELLKTSNGKYVAPAPIESRYKEHILVEQMMVIGDNQRFVSALILPTEEPLLKWCAEHGRHHDSLATAIEDQQVIDRYQQLCDSINPEFSKIEQVKKIVLIAESWEPIKADGSAAELTPTLKLKRRVIYDKYKEQIEALYVI